MKRRLCILLFALLAALFTTGVAVGEGMNVNLYTQLSGNPTAYAQSTTT